MSQSGSKMISDTGRTPLLAGLASLPVTALLLWLDAGTYAVLAPAFFAGSAVGYLFSGRPAGSSGAGWRTGLIGGLAVLWPMLDFATLIPGQFRSAVISGFAGVAFVSFVVLYVLLFGAVGAIGGAVGDRVSRRVDGS